MFIIIFEVLRIYISLDLVKEREGRCIIILYLTFHGYIFVDLVKGREVR